MEGIGFRSGNSKPVQHRAYTMAFDESLLTRGQLRKLSALRKSIGDDLAEEAFGKWLSREAPEAPPTDPVAGKIVSALSGLERDRKFNLGLYGYTIRKTRGKGQSGIVAVRNETAQTGSAIRDAGNTRRDPRSPKVDQAVIPGPRTVSDTNATEVFYSRWNNAVHVFSLSDE